MVTTIDHNNNNNNNNNSNDKNKNNNKKKKTAAAATPLPVKVEEKDKEDEEEEMSVDVGNINSDHEDFKSRDDVLKRRSKRLKQLSKIYREFYWCLIEELKTKHRDYVWNFGTYPQAQTHSSSDHNDQLVNNNDNNSNNYNNNNKGANFCEVHSCKKKAMALTRFCHTHILSDANQVLYKGCTYPTKSSPSGPTLCMKPIIKSAVPSLCSNHLEKAEKHLSRCLRKEGFNGCGSNKHPLKFNIVVAEFVRQIQSNRRENL